MSRIGKIPVAVPKEVKIILDASKVHVEGPKGKLELNIPSGIKVESKDGQLLVTRQSDIKQMKATHGTIRAYLVNMVTGVTKGHKKIWKYRAWAFARSYRGKRSFLAWG